ncbi:MAG: TonB-dependent receptor [Gammaproteobacteria bacterium]|nr:TonB-dependent receptor [Gammaproteobacteria bacterium]
MPDASTWLYAGLAGIIVAAPAITRASGLEPITVTATRVEKTTAEIPAAVSVVGQDQIQLGAEQLGLDESLGGIPGLFFLNRYNFAQDLRASIRGFGARSSFGIRGIRIVVDGIPETLPDGQGSVDGIDLGSARQISVIRGPASSLYGNASGGAILIETERGPVLPFAEVRATAGDFDFNKLQLKTGGESGDLNFLLNLSDTSIDGYRDHSEYENTQFNGRFEYTLSTTSSLLTTLHHTDQPLANDPGALSAPDAAADPTQAFTNNVLFDAGEALTQTRIGMLYKTQIGDGRDLEARVYTIRRDFGNRLPFASGGVVELDRLVTGGGLKYIVAGELAGRRNRLLAGIDYDRQDDDRSRFDNLQGVVGAQTFEQNELVTSLGIYLQNEIRLTDEIEITAGLRYDDVEFDVSDRFLSDGDDSGKVNLDQVSPMIGISLSKDGNTTIYANISSAFETPTTTEFANPSGGGFNQDLDPQLSTNYEIGIKKLAGNHRFEAAIFHIDVEDELTPFEDPAQPGRVFFENAGSSDRDGLEVAYSRALGDDFELSAAYTWSDFVFHRFEDADGDVFDGNRIPGIPRDLLRLGLSWFGDSGLYASWDAVYTGEIYADNANQVRVESYTVSNLRAGYNGFSRDLEGSVFVGANNLFDEEYFGNIRINAFGGRYFEPAPERNLFIGASLRTRF